MKVTLTVLKHRLCPQFSWHCHKVRWNNPSRQNSHFLTCTPRLSLFLFVKLWGIIALLSLSFAIIMVPHIKEVTAVSFSLNFNYLLSHSVRRGLYLPRLPCVVSAHHLNNHAVVRGENVTQQNMKMHKVYLLQWCTCTLLFYSPQQNNVFITNNFSVLT